MKEQVAVQKILRARLEEIRMKNPAYSIRAFAKKVGLSAATVSRVLNGRRRISRKLADKISMKLMLDPIERSQLLDKFPSRIRRKDDVIDPSYLQLTADQYEVIADWQSFAVLGLTEIPGFKNNPEWIATRLNVSAPQVNRVLERLKRLEMIIEDENGNLKRAKPRYRTTDDVVNLSLRKSHHQSLDLARESLDRDPVHLRDFTWVTFPLDVTKLPEVKTLIRKFQDDLYEVVEKDANPTEVYRMAVQFYPLTRAQKNEGEKS